MGKTRLLDIFSYILSSSRRIKIIIIYVKIKIFFIKKSFYEGEGVMSDYLLLVSRMASHVNSHHKKPVIEVKGSGWNFQIRVSSDSDFPSRGSSGLAKRGPAYELGEEGVRRGELCGWLREFGRVNVEQNEPNPRTSFGVLFYIISFT